MKIKDIPPENRPMERMEKYGVDALSNADLLAVILKTGSVNLNVVDMSNELINEFGIDRLSECSLKELQEIKGIGRVKAAQISAIFEFVKRYNDAKNIKEKKSSHIKSAGDVFNYYKNKLGDKDKEHFRVLHLNTKNKIINEKEIAIGILNGVLIHPREVFRQAIKDGVNSIILVHNHPSGDPEPSPEDRNVTEKLMEAGELLNIRVLDHVIIGRENYYSFKGD